MIKHTKRFATLIEILISVALSAIVISTLLFFYQQITRLDEKISTAEIEAFHLRNVQSRLNYLFSHIVSVKTKEKNEDDQYESTQHDRVVIFTSDGHGMFQGQPSLVFKTDLRSTFHPILTSDVLARVYVDAEGRLSVLILPEEDKWTDNIPPYHREVLLDNVERAEFEFYVTKDVIDAQDEKTKADFEGKLNDWISTWKYAYKVIPTQIRLTLMMKSSEKLVFYFPLIDPYKIVEYKK